MSVYRSQIQNMFLSAARKKHIPVEVVLNTGTSLRGKLKGYDQFSITLIFKDKVEVIYKSSILFITLLMKRGPVVGPRPSRSFSDKPFVERPFTERPPRPSPAPAPEAPPKPARLVIDDENPPPKRVPRVFDPEDESDPPPPRKMPTRRS